MTQKVQKLAVVVVALAAALILTAVSAKQQPVHASTASTSMIVPAPGTSGGGWGDAGGTSTGDYDSWMYNHYINRP